MRLPAPKMFSPMWCALISLIFFHFCVLLPPGLYIFLLDEQSHIFLNFSATVYFWACFAAFAAGVGFWHALVRRPVGKSIFRPQMLRSTMPMYWLFISVAVVTISHGAYLLGNLGYLADNLAFLISSEGNQIKEEQGTGAIFSYLNSVAIAFTWWGVARLLGAGDGSTLLRRLSWAVTILCGLLVVTSSVLRTARFELIPFIFGVGLIFATIRPFKLRMIDRLRVYSTTGVALAIIFIGISIARGTESLGTNFAGYSIAGYNRFGALIDGQLSFSHDGTGARTLSSIAYFPLLGRWFQLNQMMGIPEPFEVWEAGFYSIWQAGLNKLYTFSSAPGIVFVDFGLLGPLFFLLVGILAVAMWQKLEDGSVFGILLYPWFAFSVLFWFGYNLIASPAIWLYVASALIIRFGSLFGRRKPPTFLGAGSHCDVAAESSFPRDAHLYSGRGLK